MAKERREVKFHMTIVSFAELLYLLAFALLVLFQFEKTTMFHVEWPEYTMGYIYFFCVIAACLHVAVKQEKSMLRLLIMGALGFCLVFSWHTMEQLALLPTTALILGACDLETKRILKLFLILEAVLMVITLGAMFLHKIPDLVYEQAIHGFKRRHSFGFVYPTDYAAHWLFMTFAYVWIRGVKLNVLELAVIFAEAVCTWRFCDARTTAILLIGLVFGDVILQIGSWILKKESRFLHGLAGLVGFGSAVVIPLFSIFMSYYYDSTDPFMRKLDRWISHRFAFGRTALDLYQVQLWGQRVVQHGQGGTEVKPDNYFFIDSSYLVLLLKFGVAAFSAICIMYIGITLWTWKERQYIQLWILVLITATCFMEHHLFDICYNPFFLCFSSALSGLLLKGEHFVKAEGREDGIEERIEHGMEEDPQTGDLERGTSL